MSLATKRVLVCAVLAVASVAPAGALDVQNVWPDAGRHQGFGEPYLGDLDGDGDLDLVLVHHGEGVYVWRNDGGGDHWTDVTPPAFADVNDPHGVALGDFDGDGDLDIFVSKGGGLGKLLGKKVDPFFRNDGGFQFTDISEAAGTDNTQGRGRSPLWFDYDGDGDLDLLILNLQTPHVLYRNDGGGHFTEIGAGANLSDIHPKLVIRQPVDLDGDGDTDLILGGDTADAYFENRGGAFFDASDEVGLGDRGGAETFAMADYDRDGDLDLFVARSWSDKKRQVYSDAEHIAFADKRSQIAPGLDFDATGSLRFVLYGNSDPAGGFIYTGSSKKKVSQYDFVLSPSDPDVQGGPSFSTNGTPGYYIWRAGGSWHIRWNEGKQGPYVYGEIHSVDGSIGSVRKVDLDSLGIPPFRDNLYRNDNGKFVDVTDEAGIPSRPEDRSTGAAWADFDADGWPDLYIVRAGLRVVGDAPDVLLLNNGDGTFRNVSKVLPSGRQGTPTGNGEGAAAVDVNGDGRPDLFVMSGNGEPQPGMGPDQLFLNPVGGRRVLVSLRAHASAPGGFGARVLVEVGPHRQLQENRGLAGGVSYGHGAGLPLNFGLGQAVKADRITVAWPAGSVQTATDVPAGTLVVFTEGEGVTTIARSEAPLREEPRHEGEGDLPGERVP